MLRKLMKYEIKSTGRILIPIYLVLLLFTIINKVFIATGLSDKIEGYTSIPYILSIFGYGFTMAVVFIMTFFIIVQRFYKNLLSDEGYLMNTLPLSTFKNILNKIIISTFWTIISAFISILSIVIMSFNATAFISFISEMHQAFTTAYSEFGFHLYIVIFELIILGLIQAVKSITLIYASICIGHLFSKHRILSSFGAFIVLNIITSIISSILGIQFTTKLPDFFTNINSFGPVHILITLLSIYNLIFLIIYFVITNYILKNKLNLE